MYFYECFCLILIVLLLLISIWFFLVREYFEGGFFLVEDIIKLYKCEEVNGLFFEFCVL